MYLVYLLLFLVVVAVVALLIFTGPLLAVIAFVLLLTGLGIYKFLGPGTEPESAPKPQEMAPPANAPEGKMTASSPEDDETGMWGEKWPEQREPGANFD